MKTKGTLMCALALLLGACSQPNQIAIPQNNAQVSDQNKPQAAPQVTPATPATPELDSGNGEETLATDTQVAAAQASLQQLAPAALSTETLPVTTSVKADGTVAVNDQAMFPLGFYHLSWMGTPARRMADMKTIASMGFNTMVTTMFDPIDDIEGTRTLLQTANANGMKLLLEDFNAQSISALKNEPGLMGWMVADDCHVHYTTAELQTRHNTVKQADPTHLTYASTAVSYSNARSDYFGRTDMMGNQSYPIGGGDDINSVYGTLKILVAESAKKGTAPIANLQSFNWDGQRMPTTQEVYNMTSQALGAGVKGILYYTYLDQGTDLNNNAAIKTELSKAAKEIKQLTPMLLNGQRREVVASGALRVVQWAYNGKRYLQVINVSESSTTANFKLPESAGKLSALFAGRPTGLKLQADKTTLKGQMGALAVHWYQVQ